MTISVVRNTLQAWATAAAYFARLTLPRRSAGRSNAPRHVLVLADAFPPRNDGGVHRVVASVQAASRSSCRVSVITENPVSSPAGRELLSRIPEAVHVTRLSEGGLDESWRWSPRIEGRSLLTARAMLRAIAERHEADPIGVLFASGPSFVGVVVAAVASRQLGIPLVIDFRDEWTTNSFSFITHSKGDRLWERLCVRTAAHVIFATNAMQRQYLGMYPILKRRPTSTIRNGWDPPDSVGPSCLQAGPGVPSQTVVGLFGSLGDWWKLDDCLDTVRKALDLDPQPAASLRLDFVGRRSALVEAAVKELGLETVVRLVDHVPHSVAREMMGRCHALLLPNGPQMHRAAPGKLYEYFRARRPIILYGRGGEAEELLEGYPGLVPVATGDSAGLADAIRMVSAGRVTAKMTGAHDLVETCVATHARTARAQELMAVIERALATG